YSRRTVISGMSSEYECEMLWVMNADGSSEQFLDYEFQTVESAAFSPDGRRLAVLERAAEATNLYIFDVETEELSANLTDMGFGDMVSAYTWDDLGTTLYAVSGTDMMLVHQYDFDVPTENKRHGVVEKNGADEGCIAYCDGNVYFVQGDMEKGDVIYRVKCDGGVRKSFTEGSTFELSPNNKYMAINAESGISASSTASAKFRLYDMETGENITVTDEFGPQSFIWSKGGTKLYYFENRLSGEGGESSESDTDTQKDSYPYTLWMYDVATEKNTRIGDFPTTSIYPGKSENSIYLTYSDADTLGERVKATYRIDIYTEAR
ncbi:MAG: WD40 repeat domain-containing protein, partial [Clostridia bacterium]|nr:WD40 repeat domain-containing protein [Clostridia bacterium]